MPYKSNEEDFYKEHPEFYYTDDMAYDKLKDRKLDPFYSGECPHCGIIEGNHRCKL